MILNTSLKKYDENLTFSFTTPLISDKIDSRSKARRSPTQGLRPEDVVEHGALV
jgi:hypothetical protein